MAYAVVEPAGISVRLAAACIGVSEGAVRKAIRSGRLPAFRFGRRVLVDRAALEQQLAARRRAGRS
jgi:excisionase family DNA binding protein